MNTTHFSYRVFYMFFIRHVFPHVTHVNHLGIYTRILYILHINHIGILDRNHMFQDTHMCKLLTCGGDINLATIQLLCATIQGHCCVTTIQPVWLPCSYHMAPCNSWVATRLCVATIQLPCDYHTTLMWCTIICE